jgi:diaminopimelate epimerase
VKIHFSKYQATGNDFVLIDNRSAQYNLTIDQIRKICDRKFGVGADGLMLIEKHPTLDFNLVYYNSDGSQSLCGNGSRAAVRMASALNMVNGKAVFNAYDGEHAAELLPAGIVKLKMNDVTTTKKVGEDYFINTGSPHYIKFVKDIRQYPVFKEGREIRYNVQYQPGGTNVNFVELLPDNTIFVRTYEKGVEDETLSCGTGIVAAALAASLKGYRSPIKVKALGGELSVEFQALNVSQSGSEPALGAGPIGQGGIFQRIFLIGPAKLVFEGTLEL